MESSPDRSVIGRQAFTLIEVLVVVAIIALLISILLPSLAKAKEQSRRAVCAARLHNMGVSVYTYAQDNKGKIIECHSRSIQVALSPRRVDPTRATSTTPPYHLVDWQKAAKRYYLDKVTWECPNREGVFMYEGRPTLTVQGFTADMLKDMGYRVYEGADENTDEYNQWILGYQYFGGIRQWKTKFSSPGHLDGVYPARSPVDANSPGHWALAADSIVGEIEAGIPWGAGRRAYMNIAPHASRDGWPEGGNVLTFDGAATWHNEGKMIEMMSWRPADRRAWFWQQDLGEYGAARRYRKMVSGIRRGWDQ